MEFVGVSGTLVQKEEPVALPLSTFEYTLEPTGDGVPSASVLKKPRVSFQTSEGSKVFFQNYPYQSYTYLSIKYVKNKLKYFLFELGNKYRNSHSYGSIF